MLQYARLLTRGIVLLQHVTVCAAVCVAVCVAVRGAVRVAVCNAVCCNGFDIVLGFHVVIASYPSIILTL